MAERSLYVRRIEAGWTCAELAEAAGVTRNAVARAEKGQAVQSPRLEAIRRALAAREAAERRWRTKLERWPPTHGGWPLPPTR